MAWIHPEINGDYRIIGVTTISTIDPRNDTMSGYNTQVNNNANSVGNLSALGSTWLCVGSTGSVNAITNIGTFDSVVYNCNPTPDIIFNNSTDIWDQTGPTTAIEYRFDGVAVITPDLYTGTGADGTQAVGDMSPFAPLGTMGEIMTGRPSNTGNTWIENFPNDTPTPGYLYGISEEISTVSGSLSGTLDRVQSEIWAINSITLTGDIDFGGDVDILEALDVSQAPSTPTFGLFRFNVGPSGTAPISWPDLTERLTTINAGTNNTIEGEIGAGVVTGGVVYE